MVFSGHYLVERYFKFTFVRNPWDRLYSAYHYFACCIGSDEHRDHRWASTILSGISSFEEFVLRLEEPGYASMVKQYDHFRDQVEWLIDPGSGGLIMDFIGRFETLDRDFDHVRKTLGIDVALPHRRKSSGKSYRKDYSREMVRIVHSLYLRDVELLGYEFDD